MNLSQNNEINTSIVQSHTARSAKANSSTGKKQVVVIHGGDTFETYEKYLNFLRSFEIDSLDYFTDKRWENGLQKKIFIKKNVRIK